MISVGTKLMASPFQNLSQVLYSIAWTSLPVNYDTSGYSSGHDSAVACKRTLKLNK